MRASGLKSIMAAALLGSACLPTDTRPPPGELLVTATGDRDLVDGVTTADGWAVRYDRFLVSLGHASAEGDDCIGYSDPDYARVLDARRAGPQKVGLLFALGRCDFDWELSSPQADSVLGDGVTEADKLLMRTPESNAYATAAGLSILAEGRATKDGDEKTFSLAYRERVDSAECWTTVDGERVSGFELAESERATLDLTVRGRALFEDAADLTTAAVRFQPFADADDLTGDADGVVTLEELRAVPLADVGAAESYAAPPVTRGAWTSLGDWVYLGMFSGVMRFRGDGTCEQERFPNDRVPR